MGSLILFLAAGGSLLTGMYLQKLQSQQKILWAVRKALLDGTLEGVKIATLLLTQLGKEKETFSATEANEVLTSFCAHLIREIEAKYPELVGSSNEIQ